MTSHVKTPTREEGVRAVEKLIGMMSTGGIKSTAKKVADLFERLKGISFAKKVRKDVIKQNIEGVSGIKKSPLMTSKQKADIIGTVKGVNKKSKGELGLLKKETKVQRQKVKDIFSTVKERKKLAVSAKKDFKSRGIDRRGFR